ncbi:hypothetical protein J0X19_11860 [Hymenobacter sp. BT186]|uniref:Uncharacterized protein n=1 Tax=Hymenobacter telluris TaxID=2816474 RepID=A0A939EZB9_9BACT|nr:hypothetical protein [Hymenobacter telluris]MBO0358643.1 hypothetical protein [Hymenobacter telluris]MBW3374669.1 hypothetical protein [Hymenobacter norwichensis]
MLNENQTLSTDGLGKERRPTMLKTTVYDDATHKIVPLTPTSEQYTAGKEGIEECKSMGLKSHAAWAYTAMVRAAPEHPQQPAPDVDALTIKIDQELYKIFCDDGGPPFHAFAKCNTATVRAIIDHLAANGYLSKPAPLDAERAAALELRLLENIAEKIEDGRINHGHAKHVRKSIETIRAALTTDPRHDREQGLVEALRFYAEAEHWKAEKTRGYGKAVFDMGIIARKCLAEYEASKGDA